MYKALMIEDHKEVRDFVKEYFNHKEIEVVEAQNGYEGLSLLDDTIDIMKFVNKLEVNIIHLLFL